MAAVPQTLEEVLVEAGRITQEQLDQALAKQKETGAFLGQILVELEFIDENSLTSFLAKYCKIPHLSLLDYLIDQSQLHMIPQEVCLKYRLLPIDKLGKNLTVAMVNPLNQEALEKVRELCPDLRIKPILCAWNHYETVASRMFGDKVKQAAEAPAQAPPELKPKPAVEAPAQAPPELKPKPAVEAPAQAPPEPEPKPAAEAPAQAPPEPKPKPAVEAPAQAPPEPEPKPAAEKSFDDEAVLNEVFKAEEAEAEAPVALAASKTGEVGSSIMQEVVSVMRDSMRDTYAILARRMELFRGLEPEVVARIFSKGMTLEFEAGHAIFEKGDESEELYAILGGKVDIVDGNRRLATLSRGDMFGEMALVSSEPRSATAVAVETTSVLVLTFDVFEKILPKEAAIQLLVNIVITLSDRLRTANNYINAHLSDRA